MNFKSRTPNRGTGSKDPFGTKNPKDDGISTHIFLSTAVGPVTLQIRGETERSEALRLLVENPNPKEGMTEDLEARLLKAIDILRTSTPSYEPGSEIGFDRQIALLLVEYARDDYPSTTVRDAAKKALGSCRDMY